MVVHPPASAGGHPLLPGDRHPSLEHPLHQGIESINQSTHNNQSVNPTPISRLTHTNQSPTPINHPQQSITNPTQSIT